MTPLSDGTVASIRELLGRKTTVRNGVCLLCGSGVLEATGEHIRDDLPPCFGKKAGSDKSSSGGESRRDPGTAKGPVLPTDAPRLSEPYEEVARADA